MIPYYKRARVRAFAAVAVPGAGLAAAADTPTVQQATPEQVMLVLGGFVVVVAGALALAFVRWLNRVERNVPRDPERIGDQLLSLHAEITQLRGELDQLRDRQVQSIDRRVARIEGNLGALVSAPSEDR